MAINSDFKNLPFALPNQPPQMSSQTPEEETKSSSVEASPPNIIASKKDYINAAKIFLEKAKLNTPDYRAFTLKQLIQLQISKLVNGIKDPPKLQLETLWTFLANFENNPKTDEVKSVRESSLQDLSSLVPANR